MDRLNEAAAEAVVGDGAVGVAEEDSGAVAEGLCTTGTATTPSSMTTALGRTEEEDPGKTVAKRATSGEKTWEADLVAEVATETRTECRGREVLKTSKS